MPRILRIINRFNLGGPVYNAAYLTRFMPPEFETLLIGGVCGEDEEDASFILKNLGVEARIIPNMRRSLNLLNDIRSLAEIQRIIRDFKPDIVHTHASKAGALGRMAAHSQKVPIIVHTFHGHVFEGYFGPVQTAFYKWFERRMAAVSSKIIAISPSQKEDLAVKFRICPEEKIAVIPLGFDLSRFQTDQERKRIAFRQHWEVADDEIVVSIIGRIVPIKNHRMFIDAIRMLKEQTDIKIRVFVAGDGELKQELFKYAQDSGLSVAEHTSASGRPTICFTSWIREVDEIMAGSDIIALTSNNEGTPVSLIEAQAAAKPVVSTLAGGVGDAVIPFETAMLSAVGDTKGFCMNLLQLAENKELRAAMGAKGRDFANRHFHYTRLVSDMAGLYNNLMEMKRKPKK